ncbi:MAG: undecaprenyldiphospho-muramoylpentapeptide beta-N-acetylglucosaminyltransferase [Bacteroidales bacterium]|nr:undecaprenyldiphospho-muramoylpentapeptide beta-N-acetylglucosaminyltransferase [Bacteroidales bacterium]
MNRKIIISGGGTGGHIFPALSIAREIRKRDPETSLLFVGAKGKMEMEKIPASGFPIIGLPVEGLHRKRIHKNILVLFKLIISMFKAARILRTFRPDLVIGVGGYASGPILGMAVLKRIPFVIQEQNSYAGITNRSLGSKAARIFVAYPEMNRYFPEQKITLSGNPVREEVIHEHVKAMEAYRHFDIHPGKPVILILGGSQGAATINQSILSHLDLIEGENIHILWQTGMFYYRQIKEEIKGKDLRNLTFVDFINRMDLAYKLAAVIVSRAGAGTISELCCVGKPIILVPSPNVADDHQTRNAMVLVKNDAAILVSDTDAASSLIPEALKLIKNERYQSVLAGNCKKMALPDSTKIIVDEIFNLMQPL